MKNSKSNILVNSSLINSQIIKSFFFNYTLTPEIECDCLINNKIFCFFISMTYHLEHATFIIRKLNPVSEEDESSMKFLFCVYDVQPENINSEKIKAKNFQLNFNAMNEESKEDNIFSLDSNDSSEYKQIEKKLSELNLMCLDKKINLILAFSFNEVAQYIYTLSTLNFEVKNKNKIITRDDIINSLCVIDNINTNDANALLDRFNNIKEICLASESELSNTKLAKNKISSLQQFLNFEFISPH